MPHIISSIRFSDYGGSDVLSLSNIELPAPGPGEIQIRHAAIGVNYIDIYHRKGVFGPKLPLPSGLGVEGVGEIVAVGPAVSAFKVGDRVAYVGGPPGGYATHRNLPAARAIHVPAGLDSTTVAASVFKGLTAEYLTHRCVSLQPGDTVLFHAAAGGVGSFASQWLKALGVTVIGTVMYDRHLLESFTGRIEIMPKGSDLFVAALENEGVDRIFGVPGEENLDLLESLRTSSIELVLTRHEQAAAFMAATHGRLTGKPGVCLATLGPGALNFSTGAAYAHLGAMPMILITGQKPVMSARQARFQIVDIVASMKPLTKMTRQIVNPAAIPATVRDAFRVAMEERPGPVHLELPEDVAGAEVENVSVIPLHALERPVPHPAALDSAAEMIRTAKRPLVMIGAAGNRPSLVEPLSTFVARTRLPFFNTQMGKGAVTGGSNLYMGTAALSEGDYVHEAVDRADLIVAIGHDTVEKPPFLMKSAGGPKVVHVGYQSATVEQVYHPDFEVIGDIGAAVEALADRLEGKLSSDDGMLELRQRILARINDRAEEDRFPVTPQRLVHDVRKVMPEDGIVCLDNGMYKIWFARNYRTHVANTLLLDNALATMGAGLPSAMMAAMCHPGRRVMAVCGDGGFMMNSQEMETAVRLGLNLVVVILNDSAYGMIRWKQAVDGFPDFGMSFGNPDFVRYAEAYGAKGSRVTAVEDLVPTLEAAFAGGGVHLVDVPIDYSENTRVLVDELRNRTPDVECA